MHENLSKKPFYIAQWLIEPSLGTVSCEQQSISLEPRVMDLLCLLAERQGKVISKQTILAALWADLIVGNDTLARAVSKLRKAFGDDARSPEYIQTIPKRGYRLIAEVREVTQAENSPPSPLKLNRQRLTKATLTLLMIVVTVLLYGIWYWQSDNSQPPSQAEKLIARADDYYMLFERSDNESAIDLYTQAMAIEPDYAAAQAGLANALVQRVIRWPGTLGDTTSDSSGVDRLSDALQQGLTQTPEAREVLAHAHALAERAVRIAPDNAAALKSLGLVTSAQGQIDLAIDYYQQALKVDANAWIPLLNLGDLYRIKGDQQRALGYLKQAYASMAENYASEPQRIGPWQAPLGVFIAQMHQQNGELQEAEIWYRKVLTYAPFDVDGTRGLSSVLIAGGDAREALRLCGELESRIGRQTDCGRRE